MPAREPDPDHTCLSGTVKAIDRNGRDAYLTVQVGGASAGRQILRPHRARIGDVVTVAVDAARAHVFDRPRAARCTTPTVPGPD